MEEEREAKEKAAETGDKPRDGNFTWKPPFKYLLYVMYV
jgi:hypothetical protein